MPETNRPRDEGFNEGNRGWAFTRRHDDGASSIWLAEYRSHLRYTPTVCHRHRKPTYLQRDRKIKKKKKRRSIKEKEKERGRENYELLQRTYHTWDVYDACVSWHPRAIKILQTLRSVCQMVAHVFLCIIFIYEMLPKNELWTSFLAKLLNF